MHDANIVSAIDSETDFTILALDTQPSNILDQGGLFINCLDIPVDIGGSILASSVSLNGIDRPIVKYETDYEDNHHSLGINNIVPKIYNLTDFLDASYRFSVEKNKDVFILCSMKIVEVASSIYDDKYSGMTFCGIDKYSSEKKGTHIKINRINFYDFDIDNDPFGDKVDERVREASL